MQAMTHMELCTCIGASGISEVVDDGKKCFGNCKQNVFSYHMHASNDALQVYTV